MLKSIGKIAKELGITPKTLRILEKSGKVTSYKTTGGHRRYKLDEIKKELFNCNPYIKSDTKTILYSRVSTVGQKKDLEYQKEKLELYATSKGYTFEVLSDIGSGLNYKRKNFNKLLKLICDNKVERVIINYKDRILRFGFEMFEQICNQHDCELVIINQTEDVTFEQELTEDLISLVTVFSARLYGRRSHKNKKIIEILKEELNEKND